MRSPRKQRVEWEKVPGVGPGASQHLELWDSVKGIKVAEAAVGGEVRQTRSWSSWAHVEERLRREGHHLSKTVKSCGDRATTTGLRDLEIPGDLTGATLDGRRGEAPAWILQGRVLPLSHFCLPCAISHSAQCLAHSGQQDLVMDKPLPSWSHQSFVCPCSWPLIFTEKTLSFPMCVYLDQVKGLEVAERKTSLLCKGSARAALVYQRLHIMPT